MVVAPREMRGTHNHQPADIAVRRHVAHFCQTPGAEEPFALDLRMAHTETWGRGVREPCREAHHHEVRGRVCRTCTCGSGHGTLCWRRDKLEKEVFKVSVVECDTELACLSE